MLKKIKQRFIAAAMTAFSAVTLILLLAVNIWYCNINASRQDSTLETLIELESRQQEEPPKAILHGGNKSEDDPFENGGEFPIPGPFGGHSREARYTTRFFLVYCGENGKVTRIDKEHIASVSDGDAESYARSVLEKNKETGYYKNYRFRVTQNESGTVIAFLNSEREIQSIKTLFLVSAVIALCSLTAVFALVLLLSGRAIAPYIRNMEMQKQFITDAGHELKTPLTSISASADILAMERPEDEWVANIQNQSARMSKLIAGLVKLSRLDEELSLSEKTDFSLSDALWEISEPAAASAAAKGFKYSQYIEDGITIHGDRSAVQQMVSELLDNAVKYSDEGGSISLTLLRKRKRIEIEVRNTFHNVTETDLTRIFDRFYRSDKSRSSSDSFGIGLSAAKAIAEKHRGTITAEAAGTEEILFKIVLTQ